MTPWHERRLVAFDVETTGKDPTEARIVTAAVALCGGGEETESLAWLTDPGVEIPEEATSIHGVSTEQARAEGRPAREVVEAILFMLHSFVEGGLALVVFNARYDLTVLDREARRYGLGTLESRVPGLRVIDPFVMDKHLDRYRKGSRKLAAMCEHYRVPTDGEHEAAADAVAVARLAWRLGKAGQVVRRARNSSESLELEGLRKGWEYVRDDLTRLHEAQVIWASDQADGLREHFYEKGDVEAAESVSNHWPLVPTEVAA